MPTTDAVTHHYVMTVQLFDRGEPDGLRCATGVLDWQPGETRQDQYNKAIDRVHRGLQKEGYPCDGFVPVFWDIAPNHPTNS